MVKYTTEELTDKEEHYAQLRSQGYTKTDAARIAYPDAAPHTASVNAAQVEARERVKKRIEQLREERNEAYGLDIHEQIRRYNQLYMMALEKGQLVVAKQMLERIDAIGGFEAAKKSEVTRVNKGDSLKDPNGDLKNDLKRFSGILGETQEGTPEEPTPDDTVTIN